MSNRPTKPLEQYPTAELPPLPPEGAPGEAAALAAEAAAAPKPRTPPEVTVLTFLDPAARQASVDLICPFVHEGAEIHAITVRRLTVAEVGEVVMATPEGESYDLYAFFAVMTGLPAPVLRGLDDDDGEALIATARPLSCRLVKALFFSPTSEPGADTPSAPLAG